MNNRMLGAGLFSLGAIVAGLFGCGPAEAAPKVATPQTCPAKPNIKAADWSKIEHAYRMGAIAVNSAIDLRKLNETKLDIDISRETAAEKLGKLDPLFLRLAEQGHVSLKEGENIRWALNTASIATTNANFENKYGACKPR